METCFDAPKHNKTHRNLPEGKLYSGAAKHINQILTVSIPWEKSHEQDFFKKMKQIIDQD